MIEINPVPAFRDNYIWLIVNIDNRTVAIVDPGDATPVIERLKQSGWTPVAILVTHHHPDHTGGINTLLQYYQIPVYGPAHESIPGMTHPLAEGDVIAPDGLDLEFSILDVPGHTAGHIAYYGGGNLFIGDTLFMAGCGRLFEGTAAQLYHSLNKVAKLPNETVVYCTHEYTLANLRFAQTVEPHNTYITARIETTSNQREKNIPTVPGTLACEKTTNPFLRTDVEDVIFAAEKFAGHKLDHPVDVFAMIRKWKDIF
jgi:hydroxyacylglutathione hydrolase